MKNINNTLKSFIAQSYIHLRHPDAIRLTLKGIGYEHYRNLNRAWILELGIKTILDIGANEGQFARLAREVFPGAKIYSFEPLPDCFEALAKALEGDSNFRPYNLAIGAREQTQLFYRSFHSPSSSFLQMEELHKEAFPESGAGQSKEPIKVKVRPLDGVLRDEDLDDNVMVKIDVQGYELEAIEGAESILRSAKIVILEMSFLDLYTNQPLFHDVYSRMHGLGFRFRGNLAQMVHPVSGEIVQADAVFLKEYDSR